MGPHVLTLYMHQVDRTASDGCRHHILTPCSAAARVGHNSQIRVTRCQLHCTPAGSRIPRGVGWATEEGDSNEPVPNPARPN
jgi:hypothetical protein